MSKTQIDPCPFCGSNKVHVDVTTVHRVRCNDCMAQGPVDLLREGAVQKWNQSLWKHKAERLQVRIDKLNARIEKLEKEFDRGILAHGRKPESEE